MADKPDFTLEDILAEERQRREGVEVVEVEAPVPEPEPVPVPEPEPEEEFVEMAPEPELPPNPAPILEDPPVAKKKKKKRGLFGRRKKMPDYDENEDDMYYGIQLKPLDEYRLDNDNPEDLAPGGDSFKALFDDSPEAIDQEVEANFQRLQKERRRRVAEAVQTGVEGDEDEFGLVAPAPVSAVEGDDHTMEIKLNVLNSTIELQRIDEAPPEPEPEETVSDEAVDNILQFAQAQAVEEEPEPELPEPEPEAEEIPEPEEPEPEPEPEEVDEFPEPEEPEPEPVAEETVVVPVQKKEPAPRPMAEIPYVQNVFEYRPRTIPTHIIHADVLQSALISESEAIIEGTRYIDPAPKRRLKKKVEVPEESLPADISSDESVEDYTGPEDARSIAHELKGDMSELSMRMMITGVCTLILAVVNLIFGGRFAAGGDVGSMPMVYIIMTLILTGVSIGICYRTVGNGLKALFSLSANSDSGCAVAAIAVAIQTIGAVFFQSDLADGRLHLYAVILTSLLFLNAAGKLTMLRRIHSNFRFVSSKEDKYAVRVFDDYNTSLKMVKDVVAEKPLVAYQCKAGFLKRFLELSYSPDPTEASSQMLAPIGLLSSLVLCICCLLVTKSVSSALSALAAASCACVAAANMLAVNLPLSRLCKTARRAGAMVVSYDAVEQLGDVNAVIADAGELFPPGTVVLGGIKTYGGRLEAEEAIMCASALMKEIGGPLSSVFDQVISENEDALPEVEKFHYEPGGGIVGRVDGKKIYIGNRALLINNRIELPAREEETQYASGNKSIVYIGVDTVAVAMLVLTYGADRRKKNELQRLEDSGISVLVRTTDPNITASLMSRLFGIDTNSVGILDGSLGEEAGRLLNETVPRIDAVAATKGRMESMISVVSACVGQKRMTGLLVAIQVAIVVCGFVLVAFMACFGGMKQLSSIILFLFEAVGLLILLTLPKLRK